MDNLNSFAINELAELEALRENPVIVFHATTEYPSLRTLYECLRRIKSVECLDLVLITRGGEVNAARRIALLLHEYTQHLTILVPYYARSAGTLLCLGAHQLIMGPMAELSPIDGQIGSSVETSPDIPQMISAEDIRAFRQIAEEWFGIKREEDRLQVFALLSQRIFPPSLASFYRSDRLIRQLAGELLTYQLPKVEEHTRQQIVDQLVSGYFDHGYTITRTEAQSLGLQVTFASPEIEELIWRIQEICRQRIDKVFNHTEQVTDLIISRNFLAQHIVCIPGIGESNEATLSIPTIGTHERWEILEE